MISAKERLAKILESQTIPHALLFVGSDIEKIGLEFAANLLSLDGERHKKRALTLSHPDLYIFKTEGKGGVHPIKNLRDLIHNVSLVPLEAKRKVFLIHDVERMLPTSSNALLKTFEEPPLDTVFILLTNSIDKVISTIRSRCSVFYFPITTHHPAQKDILDLLAKKISLETFAEKYQDIALHDSQFQKTLLQTWSHWYRDCALLRLKDGLQYLHFPEHIDDLKKTSYLSMEKVEKNLKKVALALERSMKLTVCLSLLS